MDIRRFRYGAIALALAGVTAVSAGCVVKDPTLRVVVIGQGTVTPAGLTRYARGTKVQLHPRAAKGWVFDRWDGAEVAGTAITMDRSKSVKAVFEHRDTDYAGLEVGRVWTYARAAERGHQYKLTIESKVVRPDGTMEYRYGPGSGWIVRYDGTNYDLVGDWGPGPDARYRNPVALVAGDVRAGSAGMQACTAVCQERVTVPAGTFTAWRYDDTSSGQLTAWFVPHIGWVKIASMSGTDELVSWQ